MRGVVGGGGSSLLVTLAPFLASLLRSPLLLLSYFPLFICFDSCFQFLYCLFIFLGFFSICVIFDVASILGFVDLGAYRWWSHRGLGSSLQGGYQKLERRAIGE